MAWLRRCGVWLGTDGGDGRMGGGVRGGGGAWGAVLAAAIAAVPAWSWAQLDEAELGKQVVTVRVYKGGDVEGDWTGVVVNDQGDVLTSSDVLAARGRDATRGRVTVVVTGEAGEREAAERWREDGAGLGLVRVEGLEGSGLVVSEAGLAPGAKVYSVVPGAGTGGVEVVEGTVGVVGIRPIDEGAEVRFVQHDATVTARGYGSPLVNECGQVVGLNVPDPREEPGRLQREKRPKRDAVFAFGAEELISRLGAREVAFERVAEACIPPEAPAAAEEEAEEPAAEAPAEEEAEAPAEEAPAEEEAEEPAAEAPAEEEAEAPAEEPAAEERRRREEAEARAREAEARAREAEARAAEERQRREEAERQRNETQEEADVVGQAVDVATQRMEEQKRIVLWSSAAGAALLLLLALFWLLSARRKRQAVRLAQDRAAAAEREAAEARRRTASAPFDCVLTGRDGGGAAVALNLRRDALGTSEGAVIGRDPMESSHVVADESVSRTHARVYVHGGVLHVEDLGSTNGTFVNGRRLVEGQGVRMRDGDELVLGALTLRVELRA